MCLFFFSELFFHSAKMLRISDVLGRSLGSFKSNLLRRLFCNYKLESVLRKKTVEKIKPMTFKCLLLCCQMHHRGRCLLLAFGKTEIQQIDVFTKKTIYMGKKLNTLMTGDTLSLD